MSWHFVWMMQGRVDFLTAHPFGVSFLDAVVHDWRKVGVKVKMPSFYNQAGEMSCCK